jgi:hypothetical protein
MQVPKALAERADVTLPGSLPLPAAASGRNLGGRVASPSVVMTVITRADNAVHEERF